MKISERAEKIAESLANEVNPYFDSDWRCIDPTKFRKAIATAIVAEFTPKPDHAITDDGVDEFVRAARAFRDFADGMNDGCGCCGSGACIQDSQPECAAFDSVLAKMEAAQAAKGKKEEAHDRP